jgi:SET domain-containing protein
MDSRKLPHEEVYVRLGLSKIDGIGVIAIRDIAQGTNLFANDTVELVWVEKSELERAGLTSAERSFYHDFGIARGDKIGCPVNFHNLTPGWYLNQPATGSEPNVRVDADLNFFASRDIGIGEELTVRYLDFSDAPDG